MVKFNAYCKESPGSAVFAVPTAVPDVRFWTVLPNVTGAIITFVVAEPLAFGTPFVADVTVARFVTGPNTDVNPLIVKVTEEPADIDVIVLVTEVGVATTAPHVAVPLGTHVAVVNVIPDGAESENEGASTAPVPEKETKTEYVIVRPANAVAGPVFVTVMTPNCEVSTSVPVTTLDVATPETISLESVNVFVSVDFGEATYVIPTLIDPPTAVVPAAAIAVLRLASVP